MKLIFVLSSDLNWTYNWLEIQIYKLTQQVRKSNLDFDKIRDLVEVKHYQILKLIREGFKKKKEKKSDFYHFGV